MAEGGRFDFDKGGDEGDLIVFGDDDKSDTTQPFLPPDASTPYHGGEQIEMQTYRQERSGLPTPPSYVETQDIESRLRKLRYNLETSLLITKGLVLRENPLSQEDRDKQIYFAKRLIRIRYPHANIDGLVLGYSRKNPMDIVYKGPKGGEYKVVLDDGSDLQKSFLNIAAVKKLLGPPAGDEIQKNSIRRKKKTKRIARFAEF